MPTLADLVRLGQTRIEVDREIAVATTDTELLKPNPMRVQLTVVNYTANRATVSRSGQPATTARGIPVPADGGFLNETFETFGKVIGDGRRAIFETGAGNLYVEAIEAYLLPGQVLTV